MIVEAVKTIKDCSEAEAHFVEFMEQVAREIAPAIIERYKLAAFDLPGGVSESLMDEFMLSRLKWWANQ